jgi:hypothetical protein
MVEFIYDAIRASAIGGGVAMIGHLPDMHNIIMAVLRRAADGHAETNDFIEYFGKTECGKSWKVRVRKSDPPGSGIYGAPDLQK